MWEDGAQRTDFIFLVGAIPLNIVFRVLSQILGGFHDTRHPGCCSVKKQRIRVADSEDGVQAKKKVEAAEPRSAKGQRRASVGLVLITRSRQPSAVKFLQRSARK
eukprot:2237320-Rhodomonas_salina.1